MGTKELSSAQIRMIIYSFLAHTQYKKSHKITCAVVAVEEGFSQHWLLVAVDLFHTFLSFDLAARNAVLASS